MLGSQQQNLERHPSDDDPQARLGCCRPGRTLVRCRRSWWLVVPKQCRALGPCHSTVDFCSSSQQPKIDCGRSRTQWKVSIDLFKLIIMTFSNVEFECGRLFAVGGRDGSSCLRTVECYDPHTNRWTLVAPMSKRRGGVGVAVAHGYLYAFGGHDAPASNPSASRFDCVERYKTLFNISFLKNCCSKPSFKWFGNFFFSRFLIHDCFMYKYGRYDPTTDTWTNVTIMSTGRDAMGVAFMGDRLLVVGGYDGQSYLSLVEAYDPLNNEWLQVSVDFIFKKFTFLTIESISSKFH